MSSSGNKPGGKNEKVSDLMLKNTPSSTKEQLIMKGLGNTNTDCQTSQQITLKCYMVVIRTLIEEMRRKSMSHTTSLPSFLDLHSASSKDTLILKIQCGLRAAASGNVEWSAWNPSWPHRALCAAAPSSLLREGSSAPAASQLLMWGAIEALGESSDGSHLPEVTTWTVHAGGLTTNGCQWRNQCSHLQRLNEVIGKPIPIPPFSLSFVCLLLSLFALISTSPSPVATQSDTRSFTSQTTKRISQAWSPPNFLKNK